MNSKVINLHINKIVLDGVGRLNRGQLALALEKELYRLISSQETHGLISQSTLINQINAKPISIGNRVREKKLGHQIASSIYRGLKI